jgi:DNA-binding beta-propeller fold protein YncE
MKSKSGHKSWFAVFVIMAMVLTACTSGGDVSQDDYDAVVAERDQAMADLDAAQGQVATATVDQQVIQSGVAAAPIEPVAIGADGWTNEESVRGGLWLVAEFDDYDSGPDAWDIAAHPRVYYTSESYASNYFEDTDEGKTLAQDPNFENFIGWHAIDAYSKEVVASGLYQYEGNIVRGPHGVGVSPDGQWGYVGWTEEQNDARNNYVGIVYTRTMKLAKILKQESPFEWGVRGQALHHIQAWTDAEGNDRVILQWGFGANGGPHFILDPNDNNRVWRAITYDDVKPMGHPFTTPSPDGHYLYISVGADWIRGSEGPSAQIAKLDLTSGSVTYIPLHGWHPIGITHSQDGRWTYVVDGHSSHVFMIDNEINEVVDEASAGVGGPYGICMNWDETLAFTVGKGEGSHNIGSVLGIMEITNDGEIDEYSSGDISQPIYLGGSASSVDHCALHPDPEVNEVWVSNMKGWETIVVDLNTLEAEAWIPTPNGGDTHGMAFVWYDGGWANGELMSDMGGPKSKTMQAEILARSTAAHAGE